MVVAAIRLRNFRNHAESAFEFGEGINALLGDNGQGKTNVLEAISYLSLTKSFYAASDLHAVRLGTGAFELDGTLVTGNGLEHAIHVGYARATGEKEFLINGSRPGSLASVIGRFPMVVLSPENSAITFGGPGERRKFIDLTLAQVSPLYLEDLIEYRRVLRQRNRLLADAKYDGRPTSGRIEPWDVSLVRYGSRIIHRRRAFVGEFQAYVQRAYRSLVGTGEEPELGYVAAGGDAAGAESLEEVAARLSRELERRRREEEQRGSTVVGPHRDELRLVLNGISMHEYASQGQHKTMLIALKIAEFFYVRERRQETPVFLLDDVFSELDRHRTGQIVGMVQELGQTIITAADQHAFAGSVTWKAQHRRFIIEHGTARTAAEGSEG